MSISKELYQQLILDHNRSPRNFGKPEKYTHYSEGYNALCGDHYWVYLTLENDELIKEIKFSGEGCAISKASASMMSELCLNKTKAEVLNLFDIFKKLVKEGSLSEAESQQMRKLMIFKNIFQYPSRVKCAILAWYTIVSALEKNQQTTSEGVDI